jgi:subtilisin family serine protease
MLVGLLLLSSWSSVLTIVDEEVDLFAEFSPTPTKSLQIIDQPGATVLPNMAFFTSQEQVTVMVITMVLSELHRFQEIHGILPEQTEGNLVLTNPEDLDGVLQHRLVTMPGALVEKLPGVYGVLVVHEDPGIPERSSSEFDPEPATVESTKIHNSDVAQSLGISGAGIKVAIVDSGIDFAHPDLNGTQARVNDTSSPWDGWPIAYDGLSMSGWLSSASIFSGSGNSWYADTTSTDIDNDSDNLTDVDGLNVSGITSLSGIFHHGLHPDTNLVSRVGADVPILVVDDVVAGVYSTVYADLDLDGNFDDEQPMRRGSETSGLDTTGDGLWDISGGMIYWISDGNNSLPFAPTYATRNGLSDRIAGNGDLVMFMLNEASGAGGNHGTLCASAVAAQGVVNNGAVTGMAPNASLVAVANYYAGGSSFEAWRFVAEGYDGIPDTGDEASIGSFSFGYSGVVDAGTDASSMYLDWLTRVYSTNTTYLVALGNGGHGYGTVASPGGSPGIVSVGAASSRGSGSAQSWGEIASWTDRGPNSQGRMDPDIVAVGWSATGDTTLNEMTDANSATRSWSGTSLATPIAAGLMALVHQAWYEEFGTMPNSQTVRDIVMSTSQDLGYDPNTQGAGWFDAGRAVQSIKGMNGTWMVSPAAVMAGDNEGIHREAGINWMLPGENSTHQVTLINPSNSTINISARSTSMVAVSHEVHNFAVNTSNGWDGYQASRPDFAFPVIMFGNNSTKGIGNETMLRARATMAPGGFDGNGNYQSENRPHLTFYRWNDTDGDGIFWNDSNNDSFVADGEWDSGDQFVELTTHAYASPQVEVRVGNPWDIDADGIILAGWMQNVRTSIIDPVPIEIDITGFTHDDDPWIILNSINTTIAPHISTPMTFSVEVPSDAIPGLHMSQIILDDGNYSWKLPVLTTVAADGPYSWVPPTVDGNLSNQTLYRETWIQGAQRWGWRAESGDWKAVAIDWPARFSHGSMIVDIDWPDNGYTDIDAHILSRTTHPYAGLSPDYPDWVLNVEMSSDNGHRGSGIWTRQTNTGDDREILVGQATQGIKQILLHSTMHGVLTNDNPVNISVGHVAAIAGNDSWVVSNWSNGAINESLIVASTMNVSLNNVGVFGWSRPIFANNESVSQDTAGSVSTSSYIYPFTVDNLSRLEIEIDSNGVRDDLDLYIYHDSNSNGAIGWSNEEEGKSGNWNSAEKVAINNPDNGQWWVVVHGYDVPTGNTTFWMSIDKVGGNDLQIGNWSELNSTEIFAQFPNGSNMLGGDIAKAWSIDFTGAMPTDVGIWKGSLEMDLDIGGSLMIPLSYNLQETAPLVTFSHPLSGSHHSNDTAILAYGMDIGAGFNTSGIEWNSTSNKTSTITGTLLNGTMVNITNLSNANLTLREVWVSTNLSEDGGVHTYSLKITDVSGRTGLATNWLVHDDEIPYLEVSSQVGSLTNQTTANLTIKAEQYSFTTLQDNQIFSSFNASGWNSSNSTGMPLWFNSTVDLTIEGQNTFGIKSVDRSGRISILNIELIRDTIAPFIECNHDYSQVHNESRAVFNCRGENGSQWWFDGIDQQTFSNDDWQLYSFNVSQGLNNITVLSRDDAGNWGSSQVTIIVDFTFPILNWTSPVEGEILDHHMVDLKWGDIGEPAGMRFKIDQEPWMNLPELTSLLGRWVYRLDTVGVHNICLQAFDSGRNLVEECRTIILNETMYTPMLDVPWNGTLTNISQQVAALYVGPEQTWRLDEVLDGGSYILQVGTGVGELLELNFSLSQGLNSYSIVVDGQGIHRAFNFDVIYDGIDPWIKMGADEKRKPILGESLFLEGQLSEPDLTVYCIDYNSQEEVEFVVDSTEFKFPINPWQTTDPALLDGMSAVITCTATDEAGNHDSAYWNITMDSKVPTGSIELIEQNGRIFAYLNIPFQSEDIGYDIIVLHDNVSVYSSTETLRTGMEFTNQYELGTASPGEWAAILRLRDDVGNQVELNSNLTIDKEESITDLISSSQNWVNIGLGLLVIILILTIGLKSIKPKSEWE